MSAATAQQTTWKIDQSHSSVEFAIKHLVFSTVKGTFNSVEGTIVADDANPVNSAVNVTIDAASVNTRDEKRDGHLRSGDFFDVATFPTITFQSTRVEPASDGEFKVFGNLTVRDVTREVVLDATFHGQGASPFGTTVAAFSGTTQFNRKDFGLNWNVALEAGGVMVSDNVKITLDIEAVKQ